MKRVQIQESEGCEKSLLFEEIVSYREPDIEAPKREECTEKIELKGPFSPLEMHLFGLTNSSLNKSIKIESNSINTVLLDTEPQDPHARFVSFNTFKIYFVVITTEHDFTGWLLLHT